MHAVHSLFQRLFAFCALVVAASVSVAPVPVSGQEWSSPTSTWHDPDFTSPRTSIIFVWLIVWLPLWIIGSVLLWRRRKHFPIAGRGANYLIAITANMFVFFYLIGLVGLGWPLGPPCSVFFIYNMCSTFVLTLTYTIRGWILVFRLEIQQFLTETRWREEKNEWKTKFQANKDSDPIPQAHLAIRVREDDSISVTTLPGHFFIQHRSWIEAKFIKRFSAATLLICAISMIIIATLDPDPIMTDHVLHSRGDLPEGASTGNQFSSSNFLSAPACLVYSSKQIVFFFLFSGIEVPIVFWIIWRLFVDKRRTNARKAEKSALYVELFGKEPPATSAAAAAALGGLNLDDVDSVKMELSYAISTAVFGTIVYFLLQPFEPGYMTYLQLSCYPTLLVASVLLPLRQSYAVSARTKALIDGSRKSSNGVNKIDVQHRLPHQKPYFSLKFILKNPSTYAVLLKFLQQEWSSENALFWQESKEFEEAALELERKIASWPSGNTDRDEDTDFTTMKASSNRPIDPASRYAVTGNVTPNSPGVRSPSPSSHMSQQQSPVPASSSPTSVTENIGSSTTTSVQMTPFKPSDETDTVLNQLHIDAHRLKVWALRICENYLARSSMYEVNIADDLSKMVQAQVKTLEQWEPALGYVKNGIAKPGTAHNPTNATSGIQTQVTSEIPSAGPEAEEFLRTSLEIRELSYPSPPPFPLSSLYRSAKLAVFELIQKDSFRRFVLTAPFADLLAKADDEEMHRVENQQDLAHEEQGAEQAMLLALTKLNSPTSIPNRIASHLSPLIGPQTASALKQQIRGHSIISQSRIESRRDSHEPIITSTLAADDNTTDNLPGVPHHTSSPITVGIANNSTPSIGSIGRRSCTPLPTITTTR